MTAPTNILLIIGICAFAGILGAWAFQKMRIPQVVGYLVIGILIGETGCGLMTTEHHAELRAFNSFALGIIGFLVGGELKIHEFKKYFRQFMAMLLGEGLGAFIIVAVLSGMVIYYVSDSVAAALAAGAVFGAIASATDPASTIDVLWEYRCRGAFTSAIIAIIALDDALAMALYGCGKAAAQLLTGSESSFATELSLIGFELGGAIICGAVIGYVLSTLLRRFPQKERQVALSVGAIMLIIGIAVTTNLDVILATMTAGFVITNLEERRSSDLFTLLRSFSIPIYVLFFVLIGARLNVAAMPAWLWLLAGLYVIGRTLGKIGGVWLGAYFSRAKPTIRNYGGLALFTQGGIAVGLSIMAGVNLNNVLITPELRLGDLIVFTVTATTLIVQLIGPPLVKFAAMRADELGRNITEEDLLSAWTVADALIGRTSPPINEREPLEILAQRFADGDYAMFPVVGADGKAVGIVSLHNMQNLFANRDCWQWLVAADVMRPLGEVLYPETNLTMAVEILNNTKEGEILAVQHTGEPLGILHERHIRQILAEELLRQRRPSGESSRIMPI